MNKLFIRQGWGTPRSVASSTRTLVGVSALLPFAPRRAIGLTQASFPRGQRGYSSEANPRSPSRLQPFLYAILGGSVGLALAHYLHSPKKNVIPYTREKVHDIHDQKEQRTVNAPWKHVDYRQVYKDIANILEEGAEDYDDGSFGPVLLRLAWHSSGTYNKADHTGGSDGATMRYAPEANHGANRGLEVARHKLEEVKKKHPAISYADLWTLGGVVSVQEMGGPQIPWRPGRADATADNCVPDGRLPDGSLKQDHVRDIFYRMGFNDQEIVALVGAHAVGRCHAERSGFDGPWTFSPISFTNEYFNQMLTQEWVPKKWSGPRQFVDKTTGTIMMLPADLSLKEDKEFRKYVELYAKDEQKFFTDFSKAFVKLLELGVEFPPDAPTYCFDPL
ncbi:heme peroxidase [Dispira simplex]|nr:heme peroxidase [Dispira simplex]